MNESSLSDSFADILTLVVTVEEIRITLGPSEEHWRKASFMSWKELPESFEAAFGEDEIAAANALPLRDMVRGMAKDRCRMHKFEEPYTDYMVGETGIGKTVRRTVTVAIQYQGDPQVCLSAGPSTITRGVTRKGSGPRIIAAAPMPTVLHSIWNFIKRPA